MPRLLTFCGTGLAKSPDIQFKMALTMRVLSEVHLLQVQLLDDACNVGDVDAMDSVNVAANSLTGAVNSHPQQGGNFWEPLLGLADIVDQQTLKVIRREICRVLGAMYCRFALVFAEQPRAFFRAVADAGDNGDRVRDACEQLQLLHECCRSHAASRSSLTYPCCLYVVGLRRCC